MKATMEQVVAYEEMKRREREKQYEQQRLPCYAPPPPEWRPEEKKSDRGVITWQM